MWFTVEKALAIEPLNKGRLIAGKNGVNNLIETVSVQEVNILDESFATSASFIPSANLMISSLYSVKDDVSAQVSTIRVMKKQGTAALALCHVGSVIKDLNPEIISVCDELDLPLILMPSTTSYNKIIMAVSNALIDVENSKLRYSLEIHDAFTDLLINENEIVSLIRRLGRITSHSYLYYDYDGQLQCTNCSETTLKKYITEYIQSNAAMLIHQRQHISIPASFNRVINIMPVFNKVTYFGVLVAVSNSALSEFDKIAIAQGQNAICISSVNKTHYNKERHRMLSVIVKEIINGTYSSIDELVSQCDILGWNLRNVRGVALLGEFSGTGNECEVSARIVPPVKDYLCGLVESELLLLSPDSAYCVVDGGILILFIDEVDDSGSEMRIQSIGKQLFSRINQAGEIAVCMGIGPCISHIKELADSFNSSQYVLQIVKEIIQEPQCVNYSDYPMYILFLEMYSNWKKPENLKKIINRMLGPLSEYDAAKNSDLEETLRVILECNMDTSLTAKHMFLHNNTVLQRKKKIIEVLNEDPFSKLNRLQYELAFFLKRILVADM